MTGELSLDISGGATAFTPGAQLSGTVGWRLPSAPQAMQLRLFWHTRGKGTEDSALIATLNWDNVGSQDSRPFSFTLPTEPYSFSGKLISLVWALELADSSWQHSQCREFIMAPEEKEILLGS